MQSEPIHETKTSLSELRRQGQPPQPMSRSESVAVVLSTETDHCHQHQEESLMAFIRHSPLVGVNELNLERNPDLTADLEL